MKTTTKGKINMKIDKTHRKLLKGICENPHTIVGEEAKPLLDFGLITVLEVEGDIVASPTQLGLEVAGFNETKKERIKFAITSDIPVPPRKTGTKRSTKYPFDELPEPKDNLYFSFHVPVSEKSPDPMKTLSSSVSSRNQKEKGEKKYIVRHAEENDPNGEGVRVFRVE